MTGTSPSRNTRPQPSASPSFPARLVSAPARRSPSLVAVRTGFWRVVHPSGAVLGYIERSADAFDAPRFTARRLIANTTRLVDVGEFWSCDDASACFSFSATPRS